MTITLRQLNARAMDTYTPEALVKKIRGGYELKESANSFPVRFASIAALVAAIKADAETFASEVGADREDR